MDLAIRALVKDEVALFDKHFVRHRAESGRGDYHFMPFAPNDPDGPKSLDARLFDLPLTVPGWQRWWVAWTGQGSIVGHVDLKGGHLRAGMHRCELGIGIERAFRHAGLGRKLMQTALDFCREAPSIDWVDLRVFAHNANARALYASLGFMEIGVLPDYFRIDGESLDDVIMTLNVRA